MFCLTCTFATEFKQTFLKSYSALYMRRAIRPYLSLLLFFVVVHPLAFSQSAPTIISGSVTDATTGSPLPYAKVELCIAPTGQVQAATLVKTDGTYRLQADVPGEYQLKISCVGYQTLRSGILHVVEEGKEHRQSFELKGTDMALGEALVKGQNAASRVQQQAFNVQALETKKLESTTLDLAHAMGKISGVKIRETGGLGSDVRVSLGGFSGRHIKLFIDGVPMDGMGTAFGLNNIPAGLAKRIEVYKGVVPIELGGDALGGAVNIVTDEERRSRVNISYSYGSFNTHRSNIYAEHTTERGLYFSLNAYQNYSDNDYEVDAKIHDFETHIYEKNKRRVRSFHNAYHNEAAVAKLGVVDKPWAERLLVGFIGGYEYKEQHAAPYQKLSHRLLILWTAFLTDLIHFIYAAAQKFIRTDRSVIYIKALMTRPWFSVNNLIVWNIPFFQPCQKHLCGIGIDQSDVAMIAVHVTGCKQHDLRASRLIFTDLIDHFRVRNQIDIRLLLFLDRTQRTVYIKTKCQIFVHVSTSSKILIAFIKKPNTLPG